MSGPKPSAPVVELICELCKKSFTRVKHTIKPGRGRFCSVACANTAKVGVYSGPIVRKPVTCPCGKSFEAVPSLLEKGRGKFCSVPCTMKWRTTRLSAAVRQPAAPKPAPQRTSITPKAADRQPPVDDDKGGAVRCHRCERMRQRGVRCECERWTPEGIAV